MRPRVGHSPRLPRALAAAVRRPRRRLRRSHRGPWKLPKYLTMSDNVWDGWEPFRWPSTGRNITKYLPTLPFLCAYAMLGFGQIWYVSIHALRSTSYKEAYIDRITCNAHIYLVVRPFGPWEDRGRGERIAIPVRSPISPMWCLGAQEMRLCTAAPFQTR